MCAHVPGAAPQRLSKCKSHTTAMCVCACVRVCICMYVYECVLLPPPPGHSQEQVLSLHGPGVRSETHVPRHTLPPTASATQVQVCRVEEALHGGGGGRGSMCPWSLTSPNTPYMYYTMHVCMYVHTYAHTCTYMHTLYTCVHTCIISNVTTYCTGVYLYVYVCT